jgi:hypothetical protein
LLRFAMIKVRASKGCPPKSSVISHSVRSQRHVRGCRSGQVELVVWLAQMVAAMPSIFGDQSRTRTGRIWRWCNMAPPPRRVRANQSALRLCRCRLCALTRYRRLGARRDEDIVETQQGGGPLIDVRRPDPVPVAGADIAVVRQQPGYRAARVSCVAAWATGLGLMSQRRPARGGMQLGHARMRCSRWWPLTATNRSARTSRRPLPGRATLIGSHSSRTGRPCRLANRVR